MAYRVICAESGRNLSPFHTPILQFVISLPSHNTQHDRGASLPYKQSIAALCPTHAERPQLHLSTAVQDHTSSPFTKIILLTMPQNPSMPLSISPARVHRAVVSYRCLLNQTPAHHRFCRLAAMCPVYSVIFHYSVAFP